MRSTGGRVAVAVGALAVVVVLFIVFAGGDDGGGDKTTSTQAQSATGAAGATSQQQPSEKPVVEKIVVVGGKPQGGVKTLEYKSGDRIQFTISSDGADEIHVHGYDVKKDVAAGDTARFSFPASIEGVFEVELEGRKQQIAELRVTPG
jgi:hypothetical protein